MRGDSRFLAHNLVSLFDFGTFGGLSDGELLDRARASRGADRRLAEGAFEALMLRHGPMVLRVCRGHLRDSNDVEDAFQATFVVLARRLGSIRRRHSVASWLYGVASRVSARARVEAARRRRVAGFVTGPGEGPAEARERAEEAFEREEIGSFLHEEVGRLPGRYREVIVLCYWEGLTQEEAAIRLGCPIGTVRSRSARARDLLRARLTRRELAPPSAFSAAILAGEMPARNILAISIPAELARATIRAFVSITSGVSTRGAVPASISILADGILGSMMMIKVKTVVLASAVIGLGFLAAGRGEQKDVVEKAPREEGRDLKPKRAIGHVDPPKPKAGKNVAAEHVDPPQPTAGKNVAADYVIEAPDLIIVEVLDALPGRPITGERLVRPDGKISLGFYGELYVAGLTLLEAKEKVIKLLQKHIADDSLGLFTNDEHDKKVTVDPKDSDRVYVDVVKSNSKFYYLQGEVNVPGRLPIKGNETVLDAINSAGGLKSSADQKKGFLYRKAAKGKPPERLTLDLEEILLGGDPSTNYQLMPGDRLVIPRDPFRKPEVGRGQGEQDALKTLHNLEGRLMDLDRKLDKVLERLGK